MTEAEQMSETLVFNSVSTRLIARNDFSSWLRYENFQFYINNQSLISIDLLQDICIVSEVAVAITVFYSDVHSATTHYLSKQEVFVVLYTELLIHLFSERIQYHAPAR
jgi:hypothetical protein